MVPVDPSNGLSGCGDGDGAAFMPLVVTSNVTPPGSRSLRSGLSWSEWSDGVTKWVGCPIHSLRKEPFGSRCAACEGTVDAGLWGRPRRFCSDACRQRSYRQRRSWRGSADAERRILAGRFELLVGDARSVLRGLPLESVQCVVTSPPYFGLRNYGGSHGELGQEDSLAEYVAGIVSAFQEVARVLTPTGVAWLNLGDSYKSRSDGVPSRHGGRRLVEPSRRRLVGDLGEPRFKSLQGVPWTVALALQREGWIIRNDIIVHKIDAQPLTARDRLSPKHEHLFLLSRVDKYFFDRSALQIYLNETKIDGPTGRTNADMGDVWRLSTDRSEFEHPAKFAVELPRRCVIASSQPGDCVLDPFVGSGTTGDAAIRLGRDFIGIDTNQNYLEVAARRLEAASVAMRRK